ncbi:MAG: sigma-70 family RNA polymerase sigma factor [Acidobacteriota bacterium]
MSDDEYDDGGAESLEGDVTQILDAWRGGKADTLERLLPIVYGELKRLAAAHLRRERSDHTLQPTALVHEAYMRLLRSDSGRVEKRSHFFAVAAQAMRRILVEHARQHQAQKRLAPSDKIPIDDGPLPIITPNIDIIELNDALDRLAEMNPRYARVVEMRYFGGLTHEEIGVALDVSVSTVERDWQVARMWLRSTVGSEPS